MRIPILHSPIGNNKFSLDSSGIAGFFGGEESFAAMNTVHLLPARRWMGWYNSPGSYFVAKKYGILPESRFWDGLFPGATVTPAKLVELDVNLGPRYTGVYSGTQLPTTGHLSNLVAGHCENLPDKPTPIPKEINHAEITKANGSGQPKISEKHRDITVTVVVFSDIDEKNWEANSKISKEHFQSISILGKAGIFATILYSIASSVLAALYGDWFSFSMILFGIIANGITLSILGGGDLCLDLTKPSPESPPGDGILWDSKKIIIVLGKERTISTILHSAYRLEYGSDPTYLRIGICSVLLFTQFLFQLFLIPQGILIGQILFLSTLAASWICNGYLASFDHEKMQTELLFKIIGTPKCYKFTSDKWAAAVAFTMAYFKFTNTDPTGIVNELIPNNTPSWNLWKKCICDAIKRADECSPRSLLDEEPKIDSESWNSNFSSDWRTREIIKAGLSDKDIKFVKSFLEHADAAFECSRVEQRKIKEETDILKQSSEQETNTEDPEDDKKKVFTNVYVEDASEAV